MIKPQDLLNLALVAINYAKAVENTAKCKGMLHAGYQAWRVKTQNFEYIQPRSEAWNSMMLATAGEYQKLRNAKSREWRAKQKLLVLAKRWEGM